MYVPLWVIVAVAAFVILLIGMVLRGRSRADELIERQRHAAPSGHRRTATHGRPAGGDEPAEAALSHPDVVRALDGNRKIEAIRHVRAHSGLGLKASKELVERHLRRR